MPVAFFQVKLSIKPIGGGQANLVVPKVLRDQHYHFVVVKDGGEEAIIQLDASKDTLDDIGKDKACTKLTAKQADTLRESYPPARLKQLFRTAAPSADEAGVQSAAEFAADDQGHRIVDSIQTVRSGFYLIDVPVVGANVPA
jgi:hypothetical protein